MADLDPESLNKLRVVDLREHLSTRGLSTSGLKADLVKRLREAIETEANGGDSSIKVESSEKKESYESSDNKIESFSDCADDVEMSNEEKMKQEKLIEEGKHFAEEKLQLEKERKAEEERQCLERERKAEEDRLRLEQERKAEEDRLRLERERKAEEDRLQLERERKAEEDRLRLERERKAEEDRLRLERERKAEEDRLRLEIERKAEEQKLRMERERKAEEERQQLIKDKKAAEERQRFEQERKAAEERQRLEQERKAAEERQRLEQERKAVEEKQRLAQEKKSEEERQRLEKERKAVAAERRMAEEAEMQKEQERWLVEEQMKRAQEEHKKRLQAEEQKRVLEEQQRLMEKELEQQNKDQQVYHLQENETDFSSPPDMNTGSYVALPSAMNIIPPPPTVLISNIPPPNSMIPTPPAGFPLSLPINISAPATPVQPFITQLSQETNSVAPTNDLTNNEVSEKMDTSEDSSAEIKLPQALEKVLALKTERAQQLGIDPDAVVQPIPAAEDKISSSSKTNVVTLVSIDEDEYGDEEDKNKKNSKSRRRKKKKKKKQHNKIQAKNEIHKRSESVKPKETSVDIDIEYVQEVIDITDPMYAQFMKIFEKFKLTEGEKEKDEIAADATKDASKEEILNPMAFRKKPIDLNDDDDEDQDEDKKEEEKPKLSKRKLKKLSRMTVAELKQKVCRPELVEMHDVTAKDPVLLLHLKASRNTVPVPRHWCFKRKYLQGKRGIEKPAFELPDFIKRTGIMEMRQALQEKEDQKTMKAKMRERVRPKLGKIDIDYQKLHDAFFKWQTKPRMTIHGDLYYEGKEFETRLKEKKPGDLSDDLRTALGMPTGPNANKCPPPWLIAMQRYGPPPSYPNLKIPGLNAPIPDGCSFGYHAGGWGKPPVDETGRPLYGDVFGTQIAENQPNIQEEEIDHTLWGELESESSEEEEEEEDEEEEEEEEKQEDETGLVTPAEGLITPSGFSSIPAGMETPDMIELRKRKIEAEKEGGETPALYTILPEKKNERVGAAMMGSTHTYDLAAAIPASKLKIPGTTSVPPQGIEVALDPSELEMDSAAMAARYEQTMREQQSQLEKEDLSDMVAEHAARQKNKRKKQQLDSAKPPKKYKEFKF